MWCDIIVLWHGATLPPPTRTTTHNSPGFSMLILLVLRPLPLFSSAVRHEKKQKNKNKKKGGEKDLIPPFSGARRVDASASVLTFCLSAHRQSYISLLFSSRFIA
jgi:hypothetical protein